MELIDKDAVVAEIERQHKILMRTDCKNIYGAQYILGFRQACRQIIDFLDILEVKEVDLENMICDWLNGNCDDAGYFNQVEFAKYFFELGLKVQKGE